MPTDLDAAVDRLRSNGVAYQCDLVETSNAYLRLRPPGPRPEPVVLTEKWQRGYTVVRGEICQIDASVLVPSGSVCWRPAFSGPAKIGRVVLYPTAEAANLALRWMKWDEYVAFCEGNCLQGER